jgi:PHD/YefM family antitoxin component YafN of YafNO toxin-antitoxin module
MQFSVRLDEIVPTKTAARELPRQLGRLEDGEVDQLVLTTHNNPRAVVLSVERYDALLEAAAAGGDNRALNSRAASVRPLAA